MLDLDPDNGRIIDPVHKDTDIICLKVIIHGSAGAQEMTIVVNNKYPCHLKTFNPNKYTQNSHKNIVSQY